MDVLVQKVTVAMRLRQMLPEDTEAVIDFLSRFPECAMQLNENSRLLIANMARHEGCCWVVMEVVNGEEVAVIAAIIASAGMTRGVIEHVATDPSVAGCGLGSRLVEKVQRAFRELYRIERVHALITKGNPAITFWLKRGYHTPDGEAAVYHGQPAAHEHFGLTFVEGDHGGVAAAEHLDREEFNGTRVQTGDPVTEE